MLRNSDQNQAYNSFCNLQLSTLELVQVVKGTSQFLFASNLKGLYDCHQEDILFDKDKVLVIKDLYLNIALHQKEMLLEDFIFKQNFNKQNM